MNVFFLIKSGGSGTIPLKWIFIGSILRNKYKKRALSLEIALLRRAVEASTEYWVPAYRESALSASIDFWVIVVLFPALEVISKSFNQVLYYY